MPSLETTNLSALGLTGLPVSPSATRGNYTNSTPRNDASWTSQSVPTAETMSSQQWSKGDSSLAPCATCDRTVAWEDHGVVCESCNQWFHASCQNVWTRSYTNLNESDVSWYCDVCGCPNHSSVVFDLHGVYHKSTQGVGVGAPDLPLN